MSIKSPTRSDAHPAQLAHAFYRGAFGAQDRDSISTAIGYWSELSDVERSFTQAHLSYLNLLQQQVNHRQLQRMEKALDVVIDTLDEWADAWFEDQDQPTDGPQSFAADEGTLEFSELTSHPDSGTTFEDGDVSEDQALERPSEPSLAAEEGGNT